MSGLGQLGDAVARGELAPVYLLWGADQTSISSAVAVLREATLRPGGVSTGMEAFNHEQFDAPYVLSAAEVLNACGQVPMMGARRLVELSSPEDWGRHKRAEDLDGDVKAPESKRDDAIAALIEYFDAPNPSTVLVVTSSGINGTSKLVKAAKKAKHVVECQMAPAGEGEAASELLAEAQRRQLPLSQAGAHALVGAVGTSLSELIPALERAVAFSNGARVEREHVEAVVATTREANAFDLTDAIGRSDHTQALEILARMFHTGEKDSGQAMKLLGLLLWQTRRLCTVKFARDPAAALNSKPYAVRKLQDQANSFDEQRLRAAYAGLARLDADLKGGSKLAYESPYIALQRWVLDTCSALPLVDPRGAR
ncbi:DNA polymerase III delta subunit [Enhygromyxa salina]|uniref:DNA polymerase III subunit delta n=1 Tax=Enhygromyxa salina TaxID=215803 RepID=A0A0C2DF02_9BACT|nr:DNA polymerase III subunit delta [Enhygromyxa salina]KIG18207.1 DNA polymerase III delta subunit [Enhygromyxa salina]